MRYATAVDTVEHDDTTAQEEKAMYPPYIMQLATRLWLAEEYLDAREARRAAEARDRTFRHRFLGRTDRQSRP
jgi:hypothetical protein